jgi:shikimate dehydrogenase
MVIKKYLVIGNPIDHSLSPKLHNFWIKKYNIKAEYSKLLLLEKNLNEVVKMVKNNKLDGFNVTVPFKKKIIPYLDTLTHVANEANSVNTVYKLNNQIVGDNTDIDGFSKSLKAINFNPQNQTAFIIGAGGVALSIIVALKKIGISKIKITNRSVSEINLLKKKYQDLNIIDWGQNSKFDIVINATSVGLEKGEKLPLNFEKVDGPKIFYDVIYNPKKTDFLLEGQELGYKIENGMRMFIYQAQQSFKIWHNITPEVDDSTINFLEND